jgi:hypothetical protein
LTGHADAAILKCHSGRGHEQQQLKYESLSEKQKKEEKTKRAKTASENIGGARGTRM